MVLPNAIALFALTGTVLSIVHAPRDRRLPRRAAHK